MTAPYRLTDAQVEDMKDAVHLLRETLYSIGMQQGWPFRPVEQLVEVHCNLEAEDALPALRRTFLLLEER